MPRACSRRWARRDGVPEVLGALLTAIEAERAGALVEA
jgi:hypothetical protein